MKKQLHKTKAELIADLKGNKQFQEKMTFTRDVLYPALGRATTSIDDALQNLSIINTFVMDKFLGLMKEKNFGDLKLIDILSKTDPKYQEMKEMLELLADKNVFEAKELLEGMRSEINLFLSEENKERQLSELKVKWIDQL